MNTLVLSLKSPVSTVLVFLVPIQVLRAAARHRVSGSGLCFLGPGLPGVLGLCLLGFGPGLARCLCFVWVCVSGVFGSGFGRFGCGLA